MDRIKKGIRVLVSLSASSAASRNMCFMAVLVKENG